MLISKKPFQRLVREITGELKTDMRFQSAALLNLQEATEHYIVGYLSAANMLAIHAKRVTINEKDMLLVRTLMHHFGIK